MSYVWRFLALDSFLFGLYESIPVAHKNLISIGIWHMSLLDTWGLHRPDRQVLIAYVFFLLLFVRGRVAVAMWGWGGLPRSDPHPAKFFRNHWTRTVRHLVQMGSIYRWSFFRNHLGLWERSIYRWWTIQSGTMMHIIYIFVQYIHLSKLKMAAFRVVELKEW